MAAGAVTGAMQGGLSHTVAPNEFFYPVNPSALPRLGQRYRTPAGSFRTQPAMLAEIEVYEINRPGASRRSLSTFRIVLVGV
jgi:hypothetical protein